MDKEKVLKIAKKKGEDIKEQAQKLVDLAVEKGTPVLEKAANEVREMAIDVTMKSRKLHFNLLILLEVKI